MDMPGDHNINTGPAERTMTARVYALLLYMYHALLSSPSYAAAEIEVMNRLPAAEMDPQSCS